jgi:hypothetical protein
LPGRGLSALARILALVTLFASPAAVAATAAATAPETVPEIEKCMRANLPRESSVQTVVFRSTDRVERVSESRARLYWKLFDEGLSKVMVRFSDPSNLRGSGVLMLEQQERRPDTFIYLPELGKVRRVSSRAAASSLFGTDFSYEDFERLMGMSADARRERIEDAKMNGRDVFVVVGYPAADANSAYERVVVRVDKETCVPLQTESYAVGGTLRKQLVVDVARIEQVGDKFVPRLQTMSDLRDETQTELIVEQIELDAKIHKKMFSERELAAGGR